MFDLMVFDLKARNSIVFLYWKQSTSELVNDCRVLKDGTIIMFVIGTQPLFCIATKRTVNGCTIIDVDCSVHRSLPFERIINTDTPHGSIEQLIQRSGLSYNTVEQIIKP